MKPGFLSRLLLNLLLTVVSLAVVFGILELATRALYPEFIDQIHSQSLTAGKRVHRGTIFGLKTRLETPDGSEQDLPGSRVILVIGDSVTNGYGLSYFDTFWAVWQRRLRVAGAAEHILPLSGYGNNVTDNIEIIHDAIDTLRARGVTIAAVIYQFNFNDLLPVTRADLKESKEKRSLLQWLRQGSWVARLRHELLNHSVLLRVVSIKAARLFYNDTAACEGLGMSAMQGYSHTFQAPGFTAQGKRSWQQFDQNIEATVSKLGDVRFAIVISPISPMIHPNLPEHHLAVPPRMDCATTDPVQRLRELSVRLGFPLCDPSEYMREAFSRYQAEGNTRTLFHENDSNHPNETGSLLMGEYCFARLFLDADILQTKSMAAEP